MKQRVLYYHATLLTGDVKQMLLPGGYVLICGDRIVDVGACADDQLPQAELRYDLAGQILMPGMISAHCHFYGQFVRGMPLSHMTSGFGSCVQTVVVNGEKVVENREMTKLDEKEVYAACRREAARLWEQVNTL